MKILAIRVTLAMAPFLIVLEGCSEAPTEASTASIQLTSKDVYTWVSTLSDAERTARIATMSQWSVTGYYQRLRAISVDTPLRLDGFEIVGTASRITTAWPSVLDLAAAFPNMGALWEAEGYVGSTKLNESDFASGIDSALRQQVEQASELGLTTGPWSMPSGPACMRPPLVTPDLSAATNLSSFWTAPDQASGQSAVVINPDGAGDLAQYLGAFDEALSDTEDQVLLKFGNGEPFLGENTKNLGSTIITRQIKNQPHGTQWKTYQVQVAGSATTANTETINLYDHGKFVRTSRTSQGSNVFCGQLPQ